MTGYESKKAAAQAKLDDDDTQVYQDHDDALTIAYQSGYYDGKKAAQTTQEPVAWLCSPDENGLFGLPTADKACKDCFPVYTAPPQPAQEPVTWMGNKDFEPIRVRIMQEAYELADRNDSEGYNAIKVMCGDVQRMLPPQRPWVGLTQDEPMQIWDGIIKYAPSEMRIKDFAQAIESKLKDKNNGTTP